MPAINTYLDSDGLLRKYGTTKAIPTTGGDYRQPGDNRNAEFTVDLSTLTAGARTIINDVTYMGAGMFIEQVDVVSDVGATGGTSVSFGLVNQDRTTVISDTALINAIPTASMTPAGAKTVNMRGSTYAGTSIGATIPSPALVTATATGTYTAGIVKLRIRYRGIGTITQ